MLTMPPPARSTTRLREVGTPIVAEPILSARATMLHRPEDIATFDRAFAVFWDGRTGGAPLEELPPEEVVIALDERLHGAIHGGLGMAGHHQQLLAQVFDAGFKMIFHSLNSKKVQPNRPLT